jgi:hypothetical protein
MASLKTEILPKSPYSAPRGHNMLHQNRLEEKENIKRRPRKAIPKAERENILIIHTLG